jgi:hypothetical protein
MDPMDVASSSNAAAVAAARGLNSHHQALRHVGEAMMDLTGTNLVTSPGSGDRGIVSPHGTHGGARGGFPAASNAGEHLSLAGVMGAASGSGDSGDLDDSPAVTSANSGRQKERRSAGREASYKVVFDACVVCIGRVVNGACLWHQMEEENSVEDAVTISKKRSDKNSREQMRYRKILYLIDNIREKLESVGVLSVSGRFLQPLLWNRFNILIRGLDCRGKNPKRKLFLPRALISIKWRL